MTQKRIADLIYLTLMRLKRREMHFGSIIVKSSKKMNGGLRALEFKSM